MQMPVSGAIPIMVSSSLAHVGHGDARPGRRVACPAISHEMSDEPKPDATATPEQRLEQLGLELPETAPAAGNYLAVSQVGATLYVSGHGPYQGAKAGYALKGRLGQDLDVEQGSRAAQLVILSVLASVKAHLGELDRVRRVAKLLCFVSSTPEFHDQPTVANGASDLLVEIFGPERGRHARSAVGMASLPAGIAVEIEAIFEVD